MADTLYSPPALTDRSPKPPGILPKNAQAWVVGGIALVMVIVIAFSGGKAPKERRAPPAPLGAVVDPDEARIQDYRIRIEQQVQKLAAEQARLAHGVQTLGDPPAGSILPAPPAAGRLSSAGLPGGYAVADDRQKNWIAQDREKREYESRYASNVALSRRPAPGKSSAAASDDINGVRTSDDASGRNATSRKMPPELQQATGNQYRLFEGTVIETVLTNRLDGYFSGPINCLVTTHVFSHDRGKLLIPQGTRALGQVSRVESEGQQRLAVAFHRLIMPDGYSVSLDKLPGLSQQGETGLLDQINHHYVQLFGASLAIGAIAGLSQANTQYGLNASAADAYRQGVASSLSQSSLHILDRYLNVLPTFTIREGHRINVYLTGDLLLPAYDNHTMPGDV